MSETSNTTEKPEEKLKWYDSFTNLALCIAGAWLLTWLLLYLAYHWWPCAPADGSPSDKPWVSANEFGDMFGALSCLFSGLAFAGLIVTLRQQKISLEKQDISLQQQNVSLQQQSKSLNAQLADLNLQREEMERSRKEFEKQNELHLNDIDMARRKEILDRLGILVDKAAENERGLKARCETYGELSFEANVYLNSNGVYIREHEFAGAYLSEYILRDLQIFEHSMRTTRYRDPLAIQTLKTWSDKFNSYARRMSYVSRTVVYYLHELKRCAEEVCKAQSFDGQGVPITGQNLLKENDISGMLEYMKTMLSPHTLALVSLLVPDDTPFIKELLPDLKTVDFFETGKFYYNRTFRSILSKAITTSELPCDFIKKQIAAMEKELYGVA